MEDLMIKIDNVSKMYKLGQIGGTTLRDELQRKMAKMKGKEDPTKKIGAKDYNKGETFMALNGVSFEVKKGERVGIIGHNGAGKSTLLKLLSRVTAPTGGEIGLNGRVASMLEVGTGFHQELTGRENIYMNGAILGMTKAEIDAKMEDIIEFSECRQFIDTPVKRYSSGMYVKLAFSVAAHLDSEIMIMDEVLAVGDMAFQKKCLDKMNDVSRQDGRTILYVSHNMNTIRQLCDRVVVLDHGKVVFDGGVEEGIEIYLNDVKISTAQLQYTEEQHFFANKSRKINLENIVVRNELGTQYAPYQIVPLTIICRSTCSCEVKCRFEMTSSSGTMIGTFFSGQYIAIREGQNLINIQLNLSHIMPGKYICSVILYEEDTYGNEMVVDGVNRGFVFDVIQDALKQNGLVWLGQYWGNIQLHNIEVEGA